MPKEEEPTPQPYQEREQQDDFDDADDVARPDKDDDK